MEYNFSEIISSGQWLPLVFGFLMCLSVLLYVILDGYDLGVGILMKGASDKDKDMMIASIGPFWDANETWLVLGVGLLLVAFPAAHGEILTALYLPTAIMLIALILRGVSFDFRAKVHADRKHVWDRAFFAGSLITALSQGYMLGLYVMGFENSFSTHLFALLSGVCVSAGYSFIGGAWLIMKTEGKLQKRAIKQTRIALWLTSLGIALVSLSTPIVSERIFERWFSIPEIFVLLPIPALTLAVILYIDYTLRKLPLKKDRLCWVPFVGAITIYLMCFIGLAYSFFPYIIPDKMTIFEAASSPEALIIILVGALFVLPCIIGYTIFAYRVFWGKVTDLKYY